MRRYPARRHRGQAQRRSVPRRPGGGRPARPPSPPGTSAGASTRTPSWNCRRRPTGAGPGCGPASPPPSPSSRPASTRMPPSWAPTARPGPAWTLPTTAPGATRRWWSPSPTPKNRSTWTFTAPTALPRGRGPPLRQGGRPVPGGRLRRRAAAGRHRLLPHRAVRPLGPRLRALRLRLRRQGEPGRAGRRRPRRGPPPSPPRATGPVGHSGRLELHGPGGVSTG